MSEAMGQATAFCQERAKECRRKADAISDSGVKQEYLDLERRWQILAEAYEVSKDLTKEESPPPLYPPGWP